MHRWGAAIGVIVALALVGSSSARADVVVTLGGPTGQPIAPGFLGLSMEYPAVAAYAGSNPSAVDPVLVQLLRNLTPGAQPVLRIGGDSTDFTWWPMRHTKPPPGIRYTLTPSWMQTTRALAAALGAHLILGLNFAADQPKLSAAEARAMLDRIGRQYIQDFEIGNEPDLYHVFGWYHNAHGAVFARPRGYSLARLIKDFSRWRKIIPDGVPVVGPALAELTWMTHLTRFLNAEPGLGAVTFHRYPLRGCSTPPTSPSYASIPNLLDNRSSAGLANEIAPYVALAHAHGVPFRLDEMNSAACAGVTGVSNTFASALWILDTLFNMARVGVDGVNIHTLPDAGYELFTLSQQAGSWSAYVHPEYYGMLLFAQAAPPQSRLLSVGGVPYGGSLKVWATRTPAGRTHVVLINEDSTTPALVDLEGLSGAGASLESLTAASLTATGGISLGGQSFGAQTTTGVLGALESQPLTPFLGTYKVLVPPASAEMFTQ